MTSKRLFGIAAAAGSWPAASVGLSPVAAAHFWAVGQNCNELLSFGPPASRA